MNAKDINVIVCDDKEDDEEDWLPPPPKNLDNSCKNLQEDSILKALRYTNSYDYIVIFSIFLFFNLTRIGCTHILVTDHDSSDADLTAKCLIYSNG